MQLSRSFNDRAKLHPTFFTIKGEGGLVGDAELILCIIYVDFKTYIIKQS
jgi:hypothetical protein